MLIRLVSHVTYMYMYLYLCIQNMYTMSVSNIELLSVCVPRLSVCSVRSLEITTKMIPVLSSSVKTSHCTHK